MVGRTTIRATIEVASDGQSLTAEFTIEFDEEGISSGEYGPGAVIAHRRRADADTGRPVRGPQGHRTCFRRHCDRHRDHRSGTADHFVADSHSRRSSWAPMATSDGLGHRRSSAARSWRAGRSPCGWPPAARRDRASVRGARLRRVGLGRRLRGGSPGEVRVRPRRGPRTSRHFEPTPEHQVAARAWPRRRLRLRSPRCRRA